MSSDTYRTIDKASEGCYKEKGSKFIAYAYPISSENEAKQHVAELKKKHHDARHHCYAYMLGADNSKFRANDDGEPSSTAGKPILGQILSHGLTNILIVVVRYFGGTKLGVSGLINAYKTAASDAVQNSTAVEKTVNDIYDVRFGYHVMNDVMKVVKEEQPEQLGQDFDLSCKITLGIRQGEVAQVIGRLKKIDSVKLEFVKTT